MSKKWSEDSRRSQSEAIYSNKPWEKSTGPTSDEGKARSSRNADKGKTPLREIHRMITKVHKERLQMLRLLKDKYGIEVKL